MLCAISTYISCPFCSRAIKMLEFTEHVNKMSKDSDFLFAEEYEVPNLVTKMNQKINSLRFTFSLYLCDDSVRNHVTYVVVTCTCFDWLWQDLKEVGKDQAWDASMLSVNRPKNRFTNILPYDHSRVKLLPSEDEEGSDYINANWMPVSSCYRLRTRRVLTTSTPTGCR